MQFDAPDLTCQIYNHSSRNMTHLEDNSIHCAVTSPPYYGLRQYEGGIVDWEDGWRGQLGSEPDPRLYISHLVAICREVKRVLRPDGIFWLNIGDSWWAYRTSNTFLWKPGKYSLAHMARSGGKKTGDLKPLDMVLIPSQLALALRADGWYIRSIPIWNKPNPMPESVNGWRWERHKIKISKNVRGRETQPSQAYDTPQGDHEDGQIHGNAIWQDCSGCAKCNPNDGYILRKGSWRPTDDYEFILMLTKSSSYYCDKYAVTEVALDPESYRGRRSRSKSRRGYSDVAMLGEHRSDSDDVGKKYPKRNLRSVWTFPTGSSPGAHFAVFPEALPTICIKASTSEVGVCASCGVPWARMIDNDRKTVGWMPTCSCGDENRVPATVLDPFAGAGTTLLAALKLGRNAVGYEISSEYCELSKQRIDKSF